MLAKAGVEGSDEVLRAKEAIENATRDERDAVLQKASFGFDFSVWECFAPLAAGARLVLADPGRQGDSRYLVRVLREHRVTFVHFVPSMLAVLLAEEDVETCVSLRQVFSGGEALAPELRDLAIARFSRLSAPLDNQYGPTEISIDTTRQVCAPGQAPGRVPIGRPIGNSRLYVVDPELRRRTSRDVQIRSPFFDHRLQELMEVRHWGGL